MRVHGAFPRNDGNDRNDRNDRMHSRTRRVPIFLLALVVMTGCSFPDVTIADDLGDSSLADASLDSSGDTTIGNNDATGDSNGSDADRDTSFVADTLGEDTAPLLVDTNPPDITAETISCDKDGDGYQPVGGSCSPGTKGADCDDLTAAANPGVKDFIGAIPPSTLKPAGDWNCDGRVDKQYTVVSTCPGLVAGCDTRGGVQVVTGCGAAIKIVACVADSILGCKDGVISDGVQGCK